MQVLVHIVLVVVVFYLGFIAGAIYDSADNTESDEFATDYFGVDDLSDTDD